MSKTRRRSRKKTQRDPDQPTQKVSGPQGKGSSERSASKMVLLAGLLIIVCAGVLAAHWPVLSAKALLFDDNAYLTYNSLVQNPSCASAKRFLTEVLEPSSVRGYYQPLTMISLMTDYAMGGRVDNLTPFHRTSLVLHIANTALIIVLLYLLFGNAWIAAAVGLLFGVHPMTVESIAWVSDRKTLLAAFFVLWCLILYTHFTRKNDWRLYIGCLVMYLLALMSKPTSTPLPLLLLLMDYWPLRRLKRRAVIEKLPFFVIGAIFALVTYISQSRTSTVILPIEFGPERIGLIICHNVIFYLYKIIWPVNLSPYYAYPKLLVLSQPRVLAAVIGTCVLIPLLVISLRRTRAALTGWLFFFIAILPTMGVVGFTHVIAADRFAYMPSVGLLMILASLLGWLCAANRTANLALRRTAVIIAVLLLAKCETVVTRRHLVRWQNTVSLYEHMLVLTPDSEQLHSNMGNVLQSQGRLAEAISHFRRALQINPDDIAAHNNLGNILSAQGKFDEAASHFRRALQSKPDEPGLLINLGNVLAAQGKLDEAIDHFRQALRINPDSALAHCNLGYTLQSKGELDEAIKHYRKALQIEPGLVQAQANLNYAIRLTKKMK